MEKKLKLPHIGMRMVKSAIGVALCFVIYFLRGKNGAPFYSAIAVLWCIQNYTRNTISNAIQRSIGTLIGAAYGLIFITLKLHVFDLGDSFANYMLLSVMIIPVIYTAVLFNKKNAAYFSTVVYLSIVVNHLGDVNPYLFVFNRSLDTLIGIALGLAINSFPIHMHKKTDSLFIVNLDGALKAGGSGLSTYSRIMLNQMLDDGMKLTFNTLRTPTTFREELSEVRPTIPIIAMDGAVLYDMSKNRFNRTYVISAKTASKIEQFFEIRDFHVFVTTIIEDMLIIYYGDFRNDAERAIYEKRSTSPYRNYLNQDRPDEHMVVYDMVIDTNERIDEVYEELQESSFADQLKILKHPSDDYPGYSYIRIYNKNAGVQDMIDYLKEETEAEDVVMVGGDLEGGYVEAANSGDLIVKQLMKLFYH